MMLWGHDLAAAGVLGLNERNAAYIMALNPRKFYPRVDDKVLTKRLAIEAGMAVPQMYSVVSTQGQVAELPALLEAHESFVIKPANGSGGDGILVVDRRRGDNYRLISGELLPKETLLHHVSNIVGGQYSLTGSPDHALVEYRVHFDSVFEPVSFQGVPDIRIIVYKGYPAMAMVRLPTRQSHGKANLHQGAVGAGVDIVTGVTTSGAAGNNIIVEHPDTMHPIAGVVVPHWEKILEIAALGYEVSGLGYLGVDMVIDSSKGPLMLEMNARPGLNIQVANRQGLKLRFATIDRYLATNPGELEPARRAAISRELMQEFGATH